MICFGSNIVSDKQTVTERTGKTNLLSSIKLKNIDIQQQVLNKNAKTLTIKKQKTTFY